jgi:hypothetical protein
LEEGVPLQICAEFEFLGVSQAGASRSSATTIRALEGRSERMTIRTQDHEVLGQIVLPVAVNVLNLERNLTRMRIAFVPAATLTLCSR